MDDDMQLSIDEQAKEFCVWYKSKYRKNITPRQVWLKLINSTGKAGEKFVGDIHEWEEIKRQELLNSSIYIKFNE